MFTTRPELSGTFGMVSTTHWLASAVAMSVLERGGNAFDAAVAAGMTLQVAEPHLNGPGGDLPAILYDAERRFSEITTIPVVDHPACICGDVLRGAKQPHDCQVFGTACTPETPIGACMVSSEGACAAVYRYRKRGTTNAGTR